MDYLDHIFEQQQAEQEELEQLYIVLRKAFPVLTDDEVSLLCYQCGIKSGDVMEGVK